MSFHFYARSNCTSAIKKHLWGMSIFFIMEGTLVVEDTEMEQTFVVGDTKLELKVYKKIQLSKCWIENTLVTKTLKTVLINRHQLKFLCFCCLSPIALQFAWWSHFLCSFKTSAALEGWEEFLHRCRICKLGISNGSLKAWEKVLWNS